jgi:hypothetical protein
MRARQNGYRDHQAKHGKKIKPMVSRAETLRRREEGIAPIGVGVPSKENTAIAAERTRGAAW